MPCICYRAKDFSTDHRTVITWVNEIVTTYRAQNLSLTLRQVYYQGVARGYIANNDKEYKRLGSIINDARLAGEIDWEAIEDRTRHSRSVPHWGTPGEIIDSAAYSYRIDKWIRQTVYCEVWVEKDAIVGILEAVCPRLDVPYFSCRGYTSQTAMWDAAQRFEQKGNEGKEELVVLHLGDHDPSGIDMTRDIQDRLSLFCSYPIRVKRIALNMDQVEQYNPPPNPTKLTDARASGYLAAYGESSWELDALEPNVLIALIEQHVLAYRNEQEWEGALNLEGVHRKHLRSAARRWEEVAALLEHKQDTDDHG